MEEINKENYKQFIFIYAEKNYGQKFKEFYEKFKDEFPYNYSVDNEEQFFKNFIEWLIIEKPLPQTSKTIVEEFIEKNPNIPDDLKQCMSRMRNVVRGKFTTVSCSQGVAVLKSQQTAQEYEVKLYDSINPSLLKSGNEITGRIHEFDDYYRFAGIFLTKIRKTDFLFPDFDDVLNFFEEDQIKKIENKILTDNKKITVLLKNYPSTWIDAICKVYKLNSRIKDEKINLISNQLNSNLPKSLEDLSVDSKYALKLILKEGGVIKYSKLKNFDDSVSYFWSEKGIPKSTIGALLGRGLIFIGKIPHFDRKLYKSAMIPLEIRDKLNQLLINDNSELNK